MKTSAKGLDFIMKEEGIVLHPYKDSAGIATIGIGSTYWEDGRKVSMSDKPISQQRAIDLFEYTLKRYEAQVNKSITRPINQNQFDALVSLCYNIGTAGFASSTVAKLVQVNPCDPNIRKWFEAWRFANKQPVLLQRRIREHKLYFS